jgi:mannose-6-phosphate isomerase-like protein (cupin superfamily)
MPSSFTHMSLADVEDSAPKFGYDEIQEARFASDDLEAESTGISFHRLKPGKRGAFAHRHEDAEEIYVVLAGSGRIRLDDDVVELAPLDAIRIAPSTTRQLEAGSDGLEWVAVGPKHEGDGELLSEWWTD